MESESCLSRAPSSGRLSNSGRLSGKAGTDRREAIADQAAQMGQLLKETLAKREKEQQSVKSELASTKAELDKAKSEHEATKLAFLCQIAQMSQQLQETLSDLEREKREHERAKREHDEKLKLEQQRGMQLSGHVDLLATRAEDLNDQVEQLKAQIDRIEKERREQQENFSRERDCTAARFRDLEKEQQSVKSELARTKAELDKANSDHEDTERAVLCQTAQISQKLQDTLAELEKEKREHKREKREHDEKHAMLKLEQQRGMQLGEHVAQISQQWQETLSDFQREKREHESEKREHSEKHTLLKLEQQRGRQLSDHVDSLSTRAEDLNDQVEKLKAQIDRLDEERREHEMLLEEDLSREKDLTAECRERAYAAEREAQTCQNLVLQKEAQIEKLQHEISELKWEKVENGRQLEIQVREVDLVAKSLEKSVVTVVPEAIQRQKQERAASAQLISVFNAREAALECLVQDKERFVLQLQDSFELLKSSSEAVVQDYEQRMTTLQQDYEQRITTLNAVIAEIQSAHERDTIALADLRASNDYMEDARRDKELLIQRLQHDLKVALTASKDAQLLLQEAEVKLVGVKVELKEAEQRISEERRQREMKEHGEQTERQRAQEVTEKLLEQLAEKQQLIQGAELQISRMEKEMMVRSQQIADEKKQREENEHEEQLQKQRAQAVSEQLFLQLEKMSQQAQEKQDALMRELNMREKELLDNHALIEALRAEVSQGEERLRAEVLQGEGRLKMTAAAEDTRMAEIEKYVANLMDQHLHSVTALEAQIQSLAQELDAVSLIASEIPLLRQQEKTSREQARELQIQLEEEQAKGVSVRKVEEHRAKTRLEQERANESSMASILTEIHSLKSLVVMLEEQNEQLTFSIRKEEGRNRTLAHELDKERQTLASQHTDVQKLLDINHQLQNELESMITFSQLSNTCAAQLDEEVKHLGWIVHEALTQVCDLRDARSAEREVRLRAGRLAALVSEMETTMMQTEEILAVESKARQSAERALEELEGIYKHLEAEHDVKRDQIVIQESRLDFLVRALAEETETRRCELENAASERRALQAQIQQDRELQAAQESEITKWRRRADDMQINADCCAVALDMLEAQSQQFSVLADSALDKGRVMTMQHAAFQERVEHLELCRKLRGKNAYALEEKVSEMAAQLAASTIKGVVAENTLKEMEVSWGKIVDALGIQLQRLGKEIDEDKSRHFGTQIRVTAQNTLLRARVQDLENDVMQLRETMDHANAAHDVCVQQLEIKVQSANAAHDLCVKQLEVQVQSASAQQKLQEELGLRKQQEHEQVIAMHERELERLNELVCCADEDKQVLDQCADKAASEIERLRKQCRGLETHVVELTAQCSQIDQLLAEARVESLNEKRRFTSEKESLWSEISRLTSQAEALQSALQDSTTENEAEVQNLRSSLAETIMKNKTLLDELDIVLATRDACETSNLDLRKHNALLKNKLAACIDELQSAIQLPRSNAETLSHGPQLNANSNHTLLMLLKKINTIAEKSSESDERKLDSIPPELRASAIERAFESVMAEEDFSALEARLQAHTLPHT